MSHKIFPFCSILSVLYSFSPNCHMYVVTSKIIKVILTMLQAKKQHYIWSIHIYNNIYIYIYIYIYLFIYLLLINYLIYNIFNKIKIIYVL